MDNRIYSNHMIKNLRAHFEKNKFKYISYPKFVFLCGKAYENEEYYSTNRGTIQKYITAQNDDIFFVLSEKLWDDTYNSDIDLLTFEEFLAEISDVIIIFVESAGSYSELGAFSYADKLFNKKLILVIDNKYRYSKSFIMTGPVAKAQNNGAKVVYAPLYNNGLLSSSELRSTVGKIIEKFQLKNSAINKRNINTDANKVLINSFVLELLEIIKITQPIMRSDLIELYKKIKSFTHFTFVKSDGEKFNKEIRYDYILKLLKIVGLIEIDNNIITTEYYKKIPSFMLKFYGNGADIERNNLICRKYRYKGNDGK
ncbi:MAG: retron St85 family effector protein [Clostridia bacterium]|nr:retron St85 family effector protein [Clostridia bacterium]